MAFTTLTKDEHLLFDVLQKHGPTTKKVILQALGWTMSTTNRAIQSLLDSGVILEAGLEESSGGRPPILYDVVPESGYLLGVHMSYGVTFLVLCDIRMRILDRERLPLPLLLQSPEEVTATVAAAAETLLTRTGVPRSAVLGAGLAVIGPMHRDTGRTGTIMSFAGPVEAWCDIPLRDMLSQALGLPVIADDSCSAGALAEYLYGEGRGCRSISYIHCEVGIISGQITGGHIVRRQDDREDGLSHLSLDALGPACTCGKRGCAVQYASTTAIRNAVLARIRAGASTMIPKEHRNENLTFLEYAEAAKQGDRTVMEELDLAGFRMGHALSNYIDLLTPDYLVLGGPLTGSFPYFYNSVLRTLKRCYGEDLGKKLRIVRSGSFGEATAALGAAAMFYEKRIGSPIMD